MLRWPVFFAAIMLCMPTAQAQTAGWIFPSTATYGATSADNGKILSTETVPGATITVSLPLASAVGAGWLMGFSEAGGHGVIVNAPLSVFILTGQKTLTSFTMPSNTNYEYFALQSDGTNFRVLTSTEATARFNGIRGTAGGLQWQNIFSTGYSATLTDNGSSLSSLLATGDVTITLPSTGLLPNGWAFTAYTGGGNAIILRPNSVSGGTLVDPLGNAVSTYKIPGKPAFNHAIVSFDGGSFRVESGGRLTMDTGTATGHFYKAQGAVIERLGDRVFIGSAANANTGEIETGPPGPHLSGTGADWLSQLRISTTSVASAAALATNGGIGLLGGARTSDSGGLGDGLATTGFCFSNSPAGGVGQGDCWGFYGEAHRYTGVASHANAVGAELESIEWVAQSTHFTPYPFSGQGLTVGMYLSSGGQYGTGIATSLALGIENNGTPWQTGISFGSSAILGTDGITPETFGEAIQMAKGHSINWYEPTTNQVAAQIFSDTLNNTAGTVSLEFIGAELRMNNATPVLRLNAVSTGQYSVIGFMENQADKWQLQKLPTNDFALVDVVGGAPALFVSASTHQVRVGEGAGGVLINAFQDFAQTLAPALPPAGEYRIYMDAADGRLKALSSAGIITVLAP